MAKKNIYLRMAQQMADAMDGFANKMLSADQPAYRQKKIRRRQSGSRLLNPEDDVKQLMTAATDLQDIWQFFVKRLNSSSELDLMCFSVADESNDFIRVKFLYPELPDPENLFKPPIISMDSDRNHLVLASQRRDTLFTSRIHDLGEQISLYFDADNRFNRPVNIFSVPFIADGRTVAIITLGFAEVDAFSQAKLSYVYTLRDQIAQLVWNLTLKDRMKTAAQLDPLTGLLTHSGFQQALDVELEKAETQNNALTTMILDINNLKEINENHGHHVGDEALCHLASTVRRSIRGLDTVARYGGNEIVAILPEADPDTADLIADRFIQAFKANLPAHLHEVSTSIGYATYPDDTKKKESLLKYTEQALHLARFKGEKTSASNKVAFREVKRINDKTVLEVFASHVAKKYNNHGIFDQLQRVMEHKSDYQNPPTAENLMLETIGSLAGALDAKDRYTRGHSQAVANYAVALAHALQMSPSEVEQVRLAAFLHDIGKIGIPESILCKNAPLNEKEWEIMKQHPVIGARQILAPVSALKDVIPLVEFHHENWDGTGYPSGLAGETIPIGARIVSIVDAFHGLTSDRAYRKALPIQDAAQILRDGSGSKWDPRLIEVFLKILNIATPKRQADEEELAESPSENAIPRAEAATGIDSEAIPEEGETVQASQAS